MAFTFTTLKTAIQEYTQNTESSFVSQLSRFILNAEERILKEAQLEVFRKSSQGSATSGNKFLSKPSDYLSPFSLSVINSNVQSFLLLKHPTFLQDYTPNAVSTTGEPTYYANWDNDSFLLAPTPDANYTMELHYFYRPVSISTSADGTSWLGTNAEVSLLYASLVEAYTFMKGEPDLLKLYNDRYIEGLQTLKNLGEAEQVSDEYRYDKIRRPVQ
jgi:hypothetical protein|tara:strand:+ start:1026 stop:1673 length:648 start_codon:yes stop_codon:yes gene_type:complete